MGNNVISAGTGIALAIIGLTVLAIIVSQNANTSSVVQAFSKIFSGSIACATQPVLGGITGGNCGTTSSSTITFN